MPVEPRLKSVVWERDGDRLRVVYDIRDHLVIDDPDGAVDALLDRLREGGRTVAGLAEALRAAGHAVSVDDVAAAVALLASYRLLEDGRRLGHLDQAEQERYHSNLAFFESFATLERSREDLQRALREAHVLVLGTGGLNSNTIPHLCGLGVGRLTLLDRDVVEPRNFARQYLYRHRDLGARKVAVAADWVRGFDPTIKVEALDASIDGPEDVAELVGRLRPDVVMSGVDRPREVDDWVNAGCVAHGVPYVRGGMWVTQGLVWSVDPGVSACRACPPDSPARAGSGGTGDTGAAATDVGGDDELASVALYRRKPRTNRGIGPVAGLLGALCAFEVLRYLTRFEPPAYAGRTVWIDFAAGCAVRVGEPVPRDPTCPVCGDAARRPRPEGDRFQATGRR